MTLRMAARMGHVMSPVVHPVARSGGAWQCTDVPTLRRQLMRPQALSPTSCQQWKIFCEIDFTFVVDPRATVQRRSSDPCIGGGGGESCGTLISRGKFRVSIDRGISHAKFRVLRKFLAHQQCTIQIYHTKSRGLHEISHSEIYHREYHLVRNPPPRLYRLRRV